jgi:hypothetical protein
MCASCMRPGRWVRESASCARAGASCVRVLPIKLSLVLLVIERLSLS